MLPDLTLDLGTPSYWFAVIAALVVLVPLVHGRARAIAIAAFDLGFACLCAGAAGAPFVIGLIGAAYLLAALIGRPGTRWLAVTVLGGALAALFVAHKLPAIAIPSSLRGALAAIGFSYVALRGADLVRAVAEQRHPPPSLAELIAYLIPFHMLAAGPIQAYDDFRTQPAVPAPLTFAAVLEAMERIAAGLFKKFVIAQAVHEVLLTGFAARGPYLLVEVQAYYLWVYLDFSAYSDIAVGVGRLLGRATPENFANPLAARNITEFWERWHISLSQFVRRNLFIPIQLALGRRADGAHPLATACTAIAFSFVLVGLWHGISPRFLAWGALHALGLIATNIYRHVLLARLGRKGVKAYLARPAIRAIATLLTFEFIAFSLALVVYPL
jgi:D-alanyl-lipoteichoic acid acyltransferase DltB (MBOAT superfamily)